MEKRKKSMHLKPSQSIMLSFAAMILGGAFLLNLPIASRSGESVGFLNALFTATSANCVTGLVVVNTAEHWTVFGRIVILMLIQIGGVGLMSVLTIAMMFMRHNISLRDRQVIQTAFSQEGIGGMVRLVRQVMIITILLEGVGAVLLAVSFYFSTPMGVLDAVFQGMFHSISAFCNAGFDNVGTSGMIPYQANVPINLILMALIVAGGLGFIVLGEIGGVLRNEKKRALRLRIVHLSLHCKIVLTVTGILTVSGFLFFLLLEWTNPKTLGSMPAWEKLLAAMFQSVTLRTAGFNTIAQDSLTDISQFISCLLMMIGGSSASTAGGMKTVTVGVIVISMVSVLRGRNRLEAFGRSLPLDLLQKALTVAMAMLIVVFSSTVLLHFTEANSAFQHDFLDLLFECSSAAGTVGVSTGITPYLSAPGKVVIIVCMYLGRLSPITVVVALNSKLHASADGISLPNERAIIG